MAENLALEGSDSMTGNLETNNHKIINIAPGNSYGDSTNYQQFLNEQSSHKRRGCRRK